MLASHQPVRVLMISKACLVGTYQRKLEEIAACPDIQLSVVVPPFWRDSQGITRLERVHTRGYDLLVEPMRFNGSYHLHYYPGLWRVMASLRPAIVHIDEEPYNLAAYQALRLARRLPAKTLFFSWQNLFRRYPPPFSWIERRVLRQVDYGLVGSEEAANVWRRKGFRGPLAVIPQFGVDPDIFAPASPPSPRQFFTIGYAGRLVPEKGVDLLIQAVAGLPGNWLLRVVGDGPRRRELHELAGVYNISGSVSFEDWLPSTEMPAFYAGLDVLVLPSRSRPNWKEQFGRVLIEAMACGVPVVGSRTGAIPDVIGEAGLLFPEGDAGALRTHLHTLMLNPELRRALGQAGRARVLTHFTQAQVAARTVEIYRALASSG